MYFDDLLWNEQKNLDKCVLTIEQDVICYVKAAQAENTKLPVDGFQISQISIFHQAYLHIERY